MFAFVQAAAFEAETAHGSEDNLFEDADEPIGVHEPEPLPLPDALPIALVDEALPIGKPMTYLRLSQLDSLSELDSFSDLDCPQLRLASPAVQLLPWCIFSRCNVLLPVQHSPALTHHLHPKIRCLAFAVLEHEQSLHSTCMHF